MVGIAQLVEHLVVVQGVAGSSPVTHPKVKQARNRFEPAFLSAGREVDLLVLVFRLERVTRPGVETVFDVQLALNLARFKLVVTKNGFKPVDQCDHAELDVMFAMYQNALLGVTRERAVNELGGVKDVVCL